MLWLLSLKQSTKLKKNQLHQFIDLGQIVSFETALVLPLETKHRKQW